MAYSVSIKFPIENTGLENKVSRKKKDNLQNGNITLCFVSFVK